jgi:hypothetical protein
MPDDQIEAVRAAHPDIASACAGDREAVFFSRGAMTFTEARGAMKKALLAVFGPAAAGTVRVGT